MVVDCPFSLMKIISWNVNSVRARVKNVLDYIKQVKPNILLLQEIKTQDENFPYQDFKEIGYESPTSSVKKVTMESL